MNILVARLAPQTALRVVLALAVLLLVLAFAGGAQISGDSVAGSDTSPFRWA